MRVTAFTDLARVGTVEILADVVVGRPAPPCRNHDDPAFADSGDPGEVDLVRVLDVDGRDVRADLTPDEAAACETAAMDEATA